MFNETLLDSSTSRRPEFKPRRWLVVIAIGLEAALIAGLAVESLATVSSLPEIAGFVIHPPIAGPLGEARPRPLRKAPSRTRRVLRQTTVEFPTEIPSIIPRITHHTAASSFGRTAGPPGIIGTGAGNVPGGFPLDLPVPAQASTSLPEPPAPRRLRVDKNVEMAKIVFEPLPHYPPLALEARIEGTVQLQVLIGSDGRVRNIQVITGNPLLVRSAVEAVSRWRYLPTYLDGQPVEVVTQVDVDFTLDD